MTKRHHVIRLKRLAQIQRAELQSSPEETTTPIPIELQLTPQTAMNSLRIARTALRARPAAIKVPFQRRGYAEAVSDKVGICQQIL
jgi:hypothetical protein